MVIKEFTCIILAPDGREYEMTVQARKESDAKRLLTNLFDTLYVRDKIVSIKPLQSAQ